MSFLTENIGQRELERAILAMIFANTKNHPTIFDSLKETYFQTKVHSDIFTTCKHLFEDGEEITPIFVIQLLGNQQAKSEVNDILLDEAPLSVQCKRYCELLFQNWFNEQIKNVKTPKDFEFLEQEKQGFSISNNSLKHISFGASDFKNRYVEKQASMFCTYFNRIDEYVGSFMGGDYIVLGATTRTGKTSIALNISMNVCMQGKKVLFCSLEMPHEQLQNRFVCMTQGLNGQKYRASSLDLIEIEKFEAGLNGLKDWDLHILTDYFLTPEKLRVYAKGKGFDFVVVDYLGLMSGGGNKSSYERVTTHSRNLKCIATELNIPMLVLVQLNRKLDERQDKRPILSDIRESGAIEQDADYVLFAHREGLYTREVPQNELEIIIAKNRHGASNVMEKLDFNLETQRIKSI